MRPRRRAARRRGAVVAALAVCVVSAARMVWLRTVPGIGGFGVQCPAGGGDWLNVPAAGVGRRVTVRITARPGTHWLLRIDGSERVHPA